MTEANAPKPLSDVEAMTRIKKVMSALVPEDYDLVSRWLCDKYGVHGTVRVPTRLSTSIPD